MKCKLIMLILVALCLIPIAYSASNTTLGFAGSILDVTTGNYTQGDINITLNISTSASCDTNVIYSEKFVNNVSGGVFSLLAGYYAVPLNLEYGRDYWSCYEITNGTFTEVFGADPFTSGKGIIEQSDINLTDMSYFWPNNNTQRQQAKFTAGINTSSIRSGGNILLYTGVDDGVGFYDENNNRMQWFPNSGAMFLRNHIYYEQDVDKRFEFGSNDNIMKFYPGLANPSNYWAMDSSGSGIDQPRFYPSSTNEARIGTPTRVINSMFLNSIRTDLAIGHATPLHVLHTNGSVVLFENLIAGSMDLRIQTLANSDRLLTFREGATKQWEIRSDNYLNPLLEPLVFNSNGANNVLILLQGGGISINTTSDKNTVNIDGDLNATRNIYTDGSVNFGTELISTAGGEIVDATGDLAMDNWEADDFDGRNSGFAGPICSDDNVDGMGAADCDMVCNSHGVACNRVFDLGGGPPAACNTPCGDGAGTAQDFLCYCE